MSDIHTSIHNVASITTQRVQINGTWRRKLVLAFANGSSMNFTLYAVDMQASLRITEEPDEYVQIEDSYPRVERSDKPFDSALSANQRTSQE